MGSIAITLEQIERQKESDRCFAPENRITFDLMGGKPNMPERVVVASLRGTKASLRKGIKNKPAMLVWATKEPKTIVLHTNILSFDVPESLQGLIF